MINEYYSTKTYSTADISEAKQCKQHSSPLQFVCTESKCRGNALLCAECLPDHRTHSWETLANIYKEMNSLHKDEYNNSEQAEVAEREIKTVISKFKRKIDKKTIQLQQKIAEKIENIKETFELFSQRRKQMDEENILHYLKTLKTSNKSQSGINALQKFVNESIKAAELKIVTILNDIQLSIDVNWLKCTTKERRTSLQCLKEQINESIDDHSPVNQLQFDRKLKHPGIQLSDDLLQATYVSNAAKGPAIILNSTVAQCARVTFEIVKLTNTAFFFPDTTIFLGVCQPSIVGSGGLRRINRSGRGAYLIGSTGWSYHHHLLDFDRKNTVGWRFTENDKITVEVNVEEGEIRFIKEGFFFDSEFRMPLGLTRNELQTLQPCISFEADVGAIVKIVSPITQL